MEKLELANIKNVLLLGATGGIGHGIMDYLLEQNPTLIIHTLTRSPLVHDRVRNETTEIINEASLTNFLSSTPSLKFELIINTIGYLENDLGGQKNLFEISMRKSS
jgi:FlaA1/EpsC-like NDP-sugar epimerase